MMLMPAILCLILVGFMYSKTRLGRELLSTGSNLRAAKLSGIPTENRVLTAHIFSGALAGIGGLMLAYTNGSFTAAIGSQVMFSSWSSLGVATIQSVLAYDLVHSTMNLQVLGDNAKKQWCYVTTMGKLHHLWWWFTISTTWRDSIPVGVAILSFESITINQFKPLVMHWV